MPQLPIDDLPVAGDQPNNPGRDSDLSWVCAVLASRRDAVLQSWLAEAAAQPFHQDEPERVIADDIPRLYDALVLFLKRGSYLGVDPGQPLDDAAVLGAARAHARARAEQGFDSTEIVVEFRLLRREIGRVLQRELSNSTPTRDVVGSLFVVNDAVDGAISVGLTALITRIEQMRQDVLMTTIHEIRQPITALKALAQLIERRLAAAEPDVAPCRDLAHRVVTEVDHINAILDLQTDAATLALGTFRLTPMPCNLLEVVERSVAEVDGSGTGRIQITFPENVNPFGIWDPVRLSQVFRNLLENAVKYSPLGSPIAIEIEGHGDQVSVRVRDHGYGIGSGDLAHIFERYRRGQSTASHAVHGWGIGLFLCRGIIEAHGGRIWAESAGPDHGTTIHIVLPRDAAASRPAGQPDA